MKSSMSGWSQRSVPIIAPRREPADMMVRHIASHTSMKLNGPGRIGADALDRRALVAEASRNRSRCRRPAAS